MNNPVIDPAPPVAWFEMPEVRRRHPAQSVWIVLRQDEVLQGDEDDHSLGSLHEYSGIDTVAIFQARREQADTLDWNALGGYTPRPHAYKDGRYKAADEFLDDDEEVIGTSLVLEEDLGGAHSAQWILHQDLVLALHLLREGDVWLAVDEGYVDVVRLQRDKDGAPVRLSIRAEFLRDYLAARGMALRGSQYCQRWAILQDASGYPWNPDGRQEEADGERFELRAFPVSEDGTVTGAMAVFRAWRTDVDEQGEVPEFGPETDKNTDGTSAHYEGGESPYTHVEGELWRDYWVEPATRSERVRRDASPEDIFYFTGASGERMPARELNREEIGRYLWFRPAIVPALLAHRGASLHWYTRDTGGISAGAGRHVYFGLNPLSLVNVYAYDVARLPIWQQRIWAGHNVAPDGGVSVELLDSQQRTQPAHTRAPEKSFVDLLGRVNVVFERRFGAPLFKPHAATAEILVSTHRFRGLDRAGMLALAKDLARLTADSIDAGLLRGIVQPPKGESWRSLRHLENALATLCGDPQRARSALTPLAGIYELRLGDAHLPSGKLEEALALVPVDASAPPMLQATQLLAGAAQSLRQILAIALTPKTE